MKPLSGIARGLRSADKRPAPAALLLFVFGFVVLRVWSYFESDPVLLARASSARRTVIFGQFSSSSVAILAVSLTVLAILYALPQRPTIEELRESDTWPALQGLLLSVALLCLITLVCSHVATAVDHGKIGIEWLEQLMLASSAVSVLALLVAGVVFAAALYVGSGPKDPSQGRGSLAGRT